MDLNLSAIKYSDSYAHGYVARSSDGNNKPVAMHAQLYAAST